MNRIPLKDAKATLSSVVDEAIDGHPSVITRHGKPEAVLVSYAEWQKLSNVPSFGRLLASMPADDTFFELDGSPPQAADL
jgi:prevent-host-death family protein